MSIPLKCCECEWWSECDPRDTPYFCPECGGQIEVAEDFENIAPDDKLSNKV